MYQQLNATASSLHTTGNTTLRVSNRHFQSTETLDVYTIHLSDHNPGEFTIKLEIDMGYMYLTNLSQSSIDFRLNEEPRLRHVQFHRKVALICNDKITLFIPHINKDNQLDSCQLTIYLLEDLSLKFELS